MTNTKNVVLLSIIVLSGLFGYLYGSQKTVEVITVEIPVKEYVWLNNTETIIEIIKVPEPFPVYINSTKIIHVPTAMTLSDWESEEELLEFIQRDKTNRITYSADFDCDDFALRMIHQASDIGRRVYYFYEWRNGTYDGNHIMCMAYVKQEALYIIWEPQNDQIWSSWSSSVGG